MSERLGAAPRFGAPRHHHRLTDSTNERARELAEAGAPGGTVVTADAQRAGRGRRGRAWVAPPGKALLLSAILRPLDAGHSLLPLAVPVAVCEGIESVAPLRCAIKWPNDVWVREPEAKPLAPGSKVAGILIEARPPDWAVIGIGVNVSIDRAEFPADLRWPARSIGHETTIESVASAVCDRLGRWVTAPEAEVLAAFRDRDALRGRPLEWEGHEGDGSGTARGIDERGNLLIERRGGETISLGAGEVQIRVD